MANKRRAANRARSSMRHRGDVGGGHLDNRESEHTEKNFRGSSTPTRSTGSHAHVGEHRGPGIVPGAGELPPLSSNMGTARSNMAGLPVMPASGATPKGMKVVENSEE